MACLKSVPRNILPCADNCLRTTNCSLAVYRWSTGDCDQYMENVTDLATDNSRAKDEAILDMNKYRLVCRPFIYFFFKVNLCIGKQVFPL